MSRFADYDPHFDPLVDAHPGEGRDYAPTYWLATAGAPPPDDGPVAGDRDTDVVIVGAGFTGLACALFLAREHGIRATVLEANRVGWGCTSRNGGQGQNAAGRLYRSQWIERWGKDVALRMDAELRESFATFAGLVKDIDCDAQPGGHLYIAHRPEKMAFLRDEGDVMRRVFGYDVALLGSDEVRRSYLHDAEAAGALHEPDGIGIHPVKLAYGYLRMARAAGATVHPSSPALAIEYRDSAYHVHTPDGILRARAVGIATGGYTCQALHPSLRSRVMPILSHSLVTRALTRAEKEATNFLTTEVITDTRKLRFYYRRLPDDRVQIGSRSAITGAGSTDPRHRQLLVDALHRKFPPLRGIEIDYCWWGWVDVSHDMMPRVFQPDPKQPLHYALGYGGNGVSYSAHAGRRLAESIVGKCRPNLPIYSSPLPGHAFAPFRRLGQRLLYSWYYLKDEKFH